MYCVLVFYIIDDYVLCINIIIYELESIYCDVLIVINVFIEFFVLEFFFILMLNCEEVIVRLRRI